MKAFYFTAIFILIVLNPSLLRAQCTADAGPDQHWCKPIEETGETILLGGEPAAIGGQTPYLYSWSIEPISPDGSDLAFYASHFLSDTTLANPEVEDNWGFEMEFILTVTDAEGSTCTDSMILTTSEFGQHLGQTIYSITVNDTIQLESPNVSTTSEETFIDSVLWQPSTGLIDVNAIQPFATPDQDVAYYCSVWDNFGCSVQGGVFQFVNVMPIGVEESEKDTEINVYPTLVSSQNQLIKIEASTALPAARFILYNLNGKRVWEEEIRSSNSSMSLPNLATGQYVYQINSSSEILKTGNISIFSP
ncbi:T9SS type A sorting domain-containing protein [Halocola ammonii]